MANAPMFPPDSYIAMSCWGDCKRCGRHQDLRFGACFTCADRIAGKTIEGGHELWDQDNPSNRWQVKADQ